MTRSMSNSYFSSNYNSPITTPKFNDLTKINTILNVVPQQEAWVVERFGKFLKILSPGLHILIPLVDRIRYVHNLKEVAVNIAEQTAITNDNVTLTIDGVLFYQVIEPFKASYEIENHEYAIKQLAQTTMRSEIGKLVLDDVFKERDALNKKIVDSIRSAAVKWGIECMRYEIRDVQPPARVLEAMQMQVEAERKKRAAILESEGLRDAAINRATGDAEAIKIKADSRASAIKAVSCAMSEENSSQAISYAVAEQYIEAFQKLAKNSNTVILPKNVGDVTSLITESLSIYKAINRQDNSGGEGTNQIYNNSSAKVSKELPPPTNPVTSNSKSFKMEKNSWKEKLNQIE